MFFQVIYSASWSALNRHAQQTLSRLHLLRIPYRKKACERMNGGQTRVPGGDAVLSLGFEVIQKREEAVDVQMLQREINHATTVAGSEKA
jgi:hypothetical protein